MASPMPSRRHLAAAPSLRPSISAGDPLGFGGDPAFVMAGAVRLPAAGTLVHGRSWRSRRPEASGIALSISVTFCVTSRSSLVPGMCWLICMMFEGLGSVSWFPIAVFSFGE